MTPEEIRAIVEQMSYAPDPKLAMASGTVEGIDGAPHEYFVYRGWDAVLANRCDKLWGDFNFQLLNFVKSESTSEPDLIGRVSKLFLEDSHWDWFKKSLVYREDKYQWFFLVVDEAPQGACLFYFPEASAIDGQGVFYIEFLAVAPWNRPNPMAGCSFRRVGSALIKCASRYAIESLGLRPGFCLHSLPKAYGFYEHIGMENYPDLDKPPLKYYEMDEQRAEKFLEGA